MSRSSIEKLNWAARHIEQLELAIKFFFDSSPYEIIFQDNAATGERSYSLVSVKEFPDEIPLICGDILHNIRSALDHLVWRLVEKQGGTPTRKTSFPIANTAEKYQTAEMRRCLEGVGTAEVDVIDSFKPYKGGNDDLWRLHTLNVIDKHRLLVTLGTAHVARSMTPTERQRIIGMYTVSHPNQPLPDFSAMLRATESVRMLKAGDVIYSVPKSELESHMNFRVEIAFNEPNVIEGKPVIETLHAMKKAASDIVLRLWGHW